MKDFRIFLFDKVYTYHQHKNYFHACPGDGVLTPTRSEGLSLRARPTFCSSCKCKFPSFEKLDTMRGLKEVVG